MTNPTAEQARKEERDAIVAWLRSEATKPHAHLDGPKWRAVLWAMMHPFKFGYFGGKVLFAILAAETIERGDHREQPHD